MTAGGAKIKAHQKKFVVEAILFSIQLADKNHGGKKYLR